MGVEIRNLASNCIHVKEKWSRDIIRDSVQPNSHEIRPIGFSVPLGSGYIARFLTSEL